MKRFKAVFGSKPKPEDVQLTEPIAAEAPQLTLDVESPLNMAQANGLFREQATSPGPDRPPSMRLTSSPLVRGAIFSESAIDSQPWSAAVGPATATGRSGRMIEKLQGEIDKLNRERKLLRVHFEDAEKTNETLNTHVQSLTDRIDNYEQSHDADQRQLARKERQLDELREEIKTEKLRTEQAQETARVAAESERKWREEARLATSIAAQKEAEYDTIVACRSRDNDQHQGGLDKLKLNFDEMIRTRSEDLEKHQQLEIIAAQQRETVVQLERSTKELRDNFKLYRNEIDTAIADMRTHVTSNDSAVSQKLEEMQSVTGQMRWVINMEQLNQHDARVPTTATTVESRRSTAPDKDAKREKQRPTSPVKFRKGKR